MFRISMMNHIPHIFEVSRRLSNSRCRETLARTKQLNVNYRNEEELLVGLESAVLRR